MAEVVADVPYQSLYRRFRPSTFDEVRGQDHIVLALRNSVRDGRVAHAYLFSGPRGTGKTSTARILAKALNCTDLHDGEPCGVCVSCVEIARGTSLDVHELDAASNNGVEAMRDLVSRAALGTPGRQKVYIVDEVHMLSTAASNALLKTLEEPPPHVVFVLATTDPQKVLPTIRSRTQHFEFHLLGPDVLGGLLDQVRRDAHLELPDAALDLAARRGRGSARDALSVLDQVLASESFDDDLPELDEIVDALAERDVGHVLAVVAHLVSSGFSPQQLAGDLVDRLRQGFLSLVAPDLVTPAGTARDELVEEASRVGLAALVRAMEVLGRAQVTMREAPDPRVNLEVALVRLAHPEADDSPEAILARIERLEAELAHGAAAPGQVPAPTPSTAPRPARPAPPVDRTPRDDSVPVASSEPEAASSEPSAPTGDRASSRRTLGAIRREAAAQRAEHEAADPPSPAHDPAARAPAVESAASPTPEATVEPAEASRESGGTFPSRDELVQAWGDQVIGRLRPKAKALYQAGRFVGVDGDRAQFGLPNDTHRGRCEELRTEVEAALSEHFGTRVGLSLVVDAGSSLPEASGAPSGAKVRRPAVEPPTTDAPDAAPDHVDHGDPEDEAVHLDDVEHLEVADVDNSAEARLLQAFPGAEEVG